MAALPQAPTVDTHSTRGGSGTIGSVHMLNQSILSQGNSAGLFALLGNQTMDAESILKLKLAGKAPDLSTNSRRAGSSRPSVPPCTST